MSVISLGDMGPQAGNWTGSKCLWETDWDRDGDQGRHKCTIAPLMSNKEFFALFHVSQACLTLYFYFTVPGNQDLASQDSSVP